MTPMMLFELKRPTRYNHDESPILTLALASTQHAVTFMSLIDYVVNRQYWTDDFQILAVHESANARARRQATSTAICGKEDQ